MLQRLSSFTTCQRAAATFLPSSLSLRPILSAQSPQSLPTIQPPTTTTTQIRPRSSRSTRGLFDGRDVRFGNNVPFSLKKTRRKWSPNVQHKVLYSEVLDELIKFKVTTGALRSIDKMGGLDNYLLNSKHVKELKTKGVGKEGQGQQVRNRIVQKLKHQERLKREAVE
ncbi:ribosomal protein L28, partial [Skeletonema marinoi]